MYHTFVLRSALVGLRDRLVPWRSEARLPLLQIIEESEERLKDEEVEEILGLVRTLLPGPPEEPAADGEDT